MLSATSSPYWLLLVSVSPFSRCATRLLGAMTLLSA